MAIIISRKNHGEKVGEELFEKSLTDNPEIARTLNHVLMRLQEDSLTMRKNKETSDIRYETQRSR